MFHHFGNFGHSGGGLILLLGFVLLVAVLAGSRRNST
jgi:hypothetical protein